MGRHMFKAQMGAEAVMQLLQDIDLEDLCERLKKKMENATAQQKVKIVKRLKWRKHSVSPATSRNG